MLNLLSFIPKALEVLPIDTQGLILARGPNVFSGYINPGLSSRSSPYKVKNGIKQEILAIRMSIML